MKNSRRNIVAAIKRKEREVEKRRKGAIQFSKYANKIRPPVATFADKSQPKEPDDDLPEEYEFHGKFNYLPE